MINFIYGFKELFLKKVQNCRTTYGNTAVRRNQKDSLLKEGLSGVNTVFFFDIPYFGQERKDSQNTPKSLFLGEGSLSSRPRNRI